jgi:hypothetical protein
MIRYLNLIVVTLIVANIYLFWGTPSVYGWVVALGGWLPWVFTPLETRRGDS